jgi:hypothetical protein
MINREKTNIKNAIESINHIKGHLASEDLANSLKTAISDKKKMDDIKSILKHIRITSINQFIDTMSGLSIKKLPKNYVKSYHEYDYNDVDGQDCLLNGMSSVFRDLIPNHTSRIPLGAFIAGIDGSSFDAAKEYIERYVEATENRIVQGLKEFSSDIKIAQKLGDNNRVLTSIKELNKTLKLDSKDTAQNFINNQAPKLSSLLQTVALIKASSEKFTDEDNIKISNAINSIDSITKNKKLGRKTKKTQRM